MRGCSKKARKQDRRRIKIEEKTARKLISVKRIRGKWKRVEPGKSAWGKTSQPTWATNTTSLFFIESFPQMCSEEKWLQNRLQADKNESGSLLAVDIQGHRCGGFCIAPKSEGFSQEKCSLYPWALIVKQSWYFFFFFLVGYVEERPWWPIQSPNKGISWINILCSIKALGWKTSKSFRYWVEITFGGRHPGTLTWRFLHTTSLFLEDGTLERNRLPTGKFRLYERIAVHWWI